MAAFRGSEVQRLRRRLFPIRLTLGRSRGKFNDLIASCDAGETWTGRRLTRSLSGLLLGRLDVDFDGAANALPLEAHIELSCKLPGDGLP
jgi:hypothetical protein